MSSISNAPGGDGGGMEIGETITGGTPNQVLYTSPTGELTSDATFTRVDGAGFNAEVLTSTNSLTAEHTLLSTGLVFGGLTSFQGGGSFITDAGGGSMGLTFSDGVALGATGLIGVTGYIDDVGGGDASVVYSSDGSLFGQAGPTLSLTAADDATYERNITLRPTGILLYSDRVTQQIDTVASSSIVQAVDNQDGRLFEMTNYGTRSITSLDPTLTNNVYTLTNSTDALHEITGQGHQTVWSTTNGTGAGAFAVFRTVAPSQALFRVSDNGIVRINAAYDLPTADGTAGQVLTTDGAGSTTFEDVPATLPELYAEAPDTAFNTTVAGSNNVAIGGSDHNLSSGIGSIALGGFGNILGNADRAGFLGGVLNEITTGADRSAIIGGQSNSISSTASIILGGNGNDIITGGSSGIFGGQNNEISSGNGTANIILGGTGNTLTVDGFTTSGTSGIISSRDSDITGSTYSAILGGQDNTLDEVNHSVILGGASSTVSGDRSAAIATSQMTVSGDRSAGLGGSAGITISGNSAVALGGQAYTVPSFSELGMGRYGTAYTPASASLWDSADRLFNIGIGSGVGTEADGFTMLKNGDIGIGVSNFEANNLARFHVREDEGGNVVKRTESTVTGTSSLSTEDVRQNGATTTSGTAGTADSIPTTSDTTITVETMVTARRTGGTAGTAGDGASYKIVGTFKNVGGTVSQIGTTTVVHSVEDQGGWDAGFSIGGAGGDEIQVQVTGATDNNVSWTTTSRIYEVSSL